MHRRCQLRLSAEHPATIEIQLPKFRAGSHDDSSLALVLRSTRSIDSVCQYDLAEEAKKPMNKVSYGTLATRSAVVALKMLERPVRPPSWTPNSVIL